MIISIITRIINLINKFIYRKARRKLLCILSRFGNNCLFEKARKYASEHMKVWKERKKNGKLMLQNLHNDIKQSVHLFTIIYRKKTLFAMH